MLINLRSTFILLFVCGFFASSFSLQEASESNVGENLFLGSLQQWNFEEEQAPEASLAPEEGAAESPSDLSSETPSDPSETPSEASETPSEVVALEIPEVSDDAPAPEAPADDAPAPEAPSDDAPAPEAPSDDAPAPEAPSDDAPAPVEAPETPSDDAPAPEAPSDDDAPAPVEAPEVPSDDAQAPAEAFPSFDSAPSDDSQQSAEAPVLCVDTCLLYTSPSPRD
eukprot:TRINITY_DN3896_c0_g1_i5.p1 TRINITY_DN3896_c0_g1~~TRINITY_DN3896_c0_g1_i5.p1  ORF type:complete len:245 (+),score=79.06 TRINITY_DN3896_c0_g1_i5:63-737(+)